MKYLDIAHFITESTFYVMSHILHIQVTCLLQQLHATT